MADSRKRFRVAFSFAGEKRDFVASLASLLANKFGEGAILYDQYHEAEFAQWKLGLTLPALYRQQTDLIVVVICSDYSEKNWCGLEWLAIHGMLMSGKHREVMLCRFGRPQLEGLYENAGFVELDQKTVEDAAKRILERLALNEGNHKDHYASRTEDSAINYINSFSGLASRPIPELHEVHGRRCHPHPFHLAGAMESDAESYVARTCDGELKTATKNHSFVWLQGDFQLGKTSLLRRYSSWLEGEWIVICPDLELCDHSTNERFWRDFFAEVEETINAQRGDVFIRSRLDWRTIKSLAQQYRFAFLLDEIGTCRANQVKKLLESLYSLAEKAPGNVKLVVSLKSDPATFLAECGFQNPKYMTSWNIVRLKSFTQDEVRKLVGLFPDKFASLLGERVERIGTLTDFRPQKVQHLLHSLWETFRLSEQTCEATAELIDEWFYAKERS